MKIILIAVAAAGLLLSLSACNDQPMDSVQAGAKEQAKAGAPARPNLAFDATVTLTPAAIAQLKGRHDNVILSAQYYGFPAKGADSSKTNQFGQVELGVDWATYPLDAKQIRISGHVVDTGALGSVADGIIYVSLRTRAATPQGVGDEVIDCSHFRGTVTKAQEAPVVITCDLVKAAGAT